MAALRVVAALLLVAGAATTIHLALSGDPLAPSSATVLAVGIVLYTTISIAGLLLSRGRWSRRLGIVVAGLDLVTVAVTGVEGWGAVGLVAAALALGGLSGRWLDGWLRHRPALEGPPQKAVVLSLGLLGLVPALGLASPEGLATAHGVLGSAGVLLGWAYARAQAWSLWAVRLALPFVAVPAVVASPWPGAVGLAALVAAVVVLGWSQEARIAVIPAADPLPEPRRAGRRTGEET